MASNFLIPSPITFGLFWSNMDLGGGLLHPPPWYLRIQGATKQLKKKMGGGWIPPPLNHDWVKTLQNYESSCSCDHNMKIKFLNSSIPQVRQNFSTADCT